MSQGRSDMHNYYMYVHVHVYIYIYIYIYVHVHVYVYVPVCERIYYVCQLCTCTVQLSFVTFLTIPTPTGSGKQKFNL